MKLQYFGTWQLSTIYILPNNTIYLVMLSISVYLKARRSRVYVNQKKKNVMNHI